ncbi:MmcQ/YjbR family DNA-binding protein [Pseudoalteromonas sp. MMG010]|uniref:MmcQ/YjbR family DNA-binding protein n=1 Tax=Pseudoalteromonas sp. MMG010 TaxID=2822685 RepID=UPI001B3A042B|nr:MmcQ/YjbR family DNA-binding protein [Pseudoalteromonas sp. MMG010]MBQ4831838.1 MmcQ/YjbR family DNA-binding protein [Pseudoalteromonas sp. MMG010]
MNETTVHEYLIKKPVVQLTQPFGQNVDVYKVNHKMFATLAEANDGQTNENGDPIWWLNLKCDPDEALSLRDIFPAVIPGYHMNKRLWNTVILDGSIPQGEIERMIDNSFSLVVDNMPEKDRQAILELL